MAQLKKATADIIRLDAVRPNRTHPNDEAGRLDTVRPSHTRPTDDAGRLDIVPLTFAARRLRAATRSFQIGIATALALHALAFSVLWLEMQSVAPSGGGGQYLEAISVSLVPSRVIETNEENPADPSAGSSAGDLAPTEGVQTPPQQTKQEQEHETEQQEQPIQQPPPVHEDDAPPPERKPEPQQQQLQTGGSTSRGLSDSPSAAAAGASPGEVNHYAIAVRAALARSRPHDIRQRGTVTITFAIAPGGEVRSARVTEASGNSALDDAALAAVRRTRFPPPPSDMTPEQLTYVVPFRFK